jgi:putative transcriptional regulator
MPQNASRADDSAPRRSSRTTRIGVMVAALAALLVGPSPRPSAAGLADGGIRRTASRFATGGTFATEPLPLAAAQALTLPHPPARRQNLSKGQLLVASRQLPDPNFARSVVLLIEYGARGAMGVIVNRPTEVKLSSALPEIEALKHRGDVLFFGGPVSVNRLMMIVRAEKEPPEALHVLGDVYASGSMKALRRVLERGTREKDVRLCAGYAGWAPGQLDAEVSRGDWLIASADAGAIFDEDPSELWGSLLARSEGRWARRDGADLAQTVLRRGVRRNPSISGPQRGPLVRTASLACVTIQRPSNRSGRPFGRRGECSGHPLLPTS